MDDLTVAIYSYPGHQELLPHLLASVQQHAPKSREIVLVWDDLRQQIQPIDFSQLKIKTSVDFRLITHSQVRGRSQAIDQWGWIRQQVIKILCPTYTTTRWVWVMDGDVLLIDRPRLFDDAGRPLLYWDDRSTDPGYVAFMRRYLKIEKFYPGDFVGSTFLFDRRVLGELDAQAQNMTGMSWVDCVDHCIQQPHCTQFPFSEFATYGTWCYNHHLADHHLESRNWNHCPAQHDPTKPLQVMWHAVPGEESLDLTVKFQRLTNNKSSAIIVK